MPDLMGWPRIASVQLRSVSRHTGSIYRSILGVFCVVMGGVLLTGFSSGESTDSPIDTDSAHMKMKEIRPPFHPPQTPDKTPPENESSSSMSTTSPSTTVPTKPSSMSTTSPSTTVPTKPGTASGPTTKLSKDDLTRPAPPEPTVSRNDLQTSPTPTSSRSTSTQNKLSDQSPTPTASTIDAVDTPSKPVPNQPDVGDQDGDSDPGSRNSQGSGSLNRSDVADNTSEGSGPGLGDGSGDNPTAGDGQGSRTGDGSRSDTGDGSGTGTGTGTGTGDGLGIGAVEDPTLIDGELEFRTCAEAYDAGVAPIAEDEPGYSLRLDRDRDGIACELNLDL